MSSKLRWLFLQLLLFARQFHITCKRRNRKALLFVQLYTYQYSAGTCSHSFYHEGSSDLPLAGGQNRRCSPCRQARTFHCCAVHNHEELRCLCSLHTQRLMVLQLASVPIVDTTFLYRYTFQRRNGSQCEVKNLAGWTHSTCISHNREHEHQSPLQTHAPPSPLSSQP